MNKYNHNSSLISSVSNSIIIGASSSLSIFSILLLSFISSSSELDSSFKHLYGIPHQLLFSNPQLPISSSGSTLTQLEQHLYPYLTNLYEQVKLSYFLVL